MYPGLNLWLQTINRMEHSLCGVYIQALHILLRKLHDIFCHRASFARFDQCLTRFVRIDCWFKVTKERSFQHSPTGHISLDIIPGICWSIQQNYSNLALLDVILQVSKLEVCIKLMAEPRDRGSIRRPSSQQSWRAAMALQPKVKWKQA